MTRLWLSIVKLIWRRLLYRVIFKRVPDFEIGPPEDPYMRRWWLIPRNRLFNAYLHVIRHSDDDRALHDHPWANLSLILSGRYIEVTPTGLYVRRTGDVVLRRAGTAHRLETIGSELCWTLFITGPRIREWGFHCPKGWVPWRVFCATDNKGEIGRGCGEMA